MTKTKKLVRNGRGFQTKHKLLKILCRALKGIMQKCCGNSTRKKAQRKLNKRIVKIELANNINGHEMKILLGHYKQFKLGRLSRLGFGLIAAKIKNAYTL